jgi:hypothetical protein
MEMLIREVHSLGRVVHHLGKVAHSLDKAPLKEECRSLTEMHLAALNQGSREEAMLRIICRVLRQICHSKQSV